jgi:FlaG/FlaF family flagellin (archaellin)
MMMVNKREDMPLSHVFGTVLMGEVAVLLAVVVMALVFTP